MDTFRHIDTSLDAFVADSASEQQHPFQPDSIQGTRSPRRLWTPAEDESLKLMVQRYGDARGSQSRWKDIATGCPGRTPKDCRKRWFHSLHPSLRKGRWSEREDRTLLAAYDRFGPAWHDIALLIPGRKDDQCSKRYNEILNPAAKTRLRSWTAEEDRILAQGVAALGHRWAAISTQLNNRPPLTCRNRWRSLSDHGRSQRDSSTDRSASRAGKTSQSTETTAQRSTEATQSPSRSLELLFETSATPATTSSDGERYSHSTADQAYLDAVFSLNGSQQDFVPITPEAESFLGTSLHASSFDMIRFPSGVDMTGMPFNGEPASFRECEDSLHARSLPAFTQAEDQMSSKSPERRSSHCNSENATRPPHGSRFDMGVQPSTQLASNGDTLSDFSRDESSATGASRNSSSNQITRTPSFTIIERDAELRTDNMHESKNSQHVHHHYHHHYHHHHYHYHQPG